MGWRLFLLAFTVSIGLVAGQPTNENELHEVRESFRNLFNSINKNDMKKTDSYRNALEQEAAREKQAFNTMKEILQSTRQRNADERRNLNHISDDTDRRVAQFKREAGSEPGQCLSELEKKFWRPPRRDTTEDEKRYVEVFGTEGRGWTWIAIWISNSILQPKIMEVCVKANRAAKLNDSIDSAVLDELGTLMFVHTNTPPISSIYVLVCIMTYGDKVDEMGNIPQTDQIDVKDALAQNQTAFGARDELFEHYAELQSKKQTKLEKVSRNKYGVWYITKGTREDCVFYLNKYDELHAVDNEYVIEREVCGMEPIDLYQLEWSSLEADGVDRPSY